MKTATAIKDLGVLRSQVGYEGHCREVATKASRMAGQIRHSFHLNSPQLLWPAFQLYVAPTLMYNSPAWRPYLRKDVALIERVQRRYTKGIRGLSELSYKERLKKLDAQSIECRMTYADMVLAYKAIRILLLLGCRSNDLGLTLVHSRTRGDGVSLQHRRATSTRSAASTYACRISSAWNKLPVHIVTSPSLATFKNRLKQYLDSEK